MIQPFVHPLQNQLHDLDPLIERIGNASYVLLGEASHGTHEFYTTRADITKRLIEEKGFTTIALEADWPDTMRINENPESALDDFKRFPSWMWRNQEMVDFVTWLKQHNSTVTNRVNIYGLDVYSLHWSMQLVIDYLKHIDPEAAQQAEKRYACFDPHGTDPQAYGYFASKFPHASCAQKIQEQFLEIQQKRYGLQPEQNARIVKNAEHYYRSMFEGSRAQSWNIRDEHMMETVVYLMEQAPEQKIVIWAHNTHLGNARATQMSDAGELNLGQLLKEAYGSQVFSVGFTTYTGSVSAASHWGGPVERKTVRPALAGSYEALFHTVGIPNFMLFTKEHNALHTLLNEPRLERAIGVIYIPQQERASHYFYARLADQFDAVIHYDKTHAVLPLEKNSLWDAGELPETFPSGL